MALSEREELELLELEEREGKGAPKKGETTTAEKIAGHPVTRVLTGAGSQGLGIMQIGSLLQDKAYEKLGIDARPGKWFTENLKSLEGMKKAGRAERGSEGFDWYELLGNLMSPGVAKGGQVISQGKKMVDKIKRAIPVGSAEAVTQPVLDDDYVGGKTKQAVTGAVLGAAVPPVGAALGAVGKGVAHAADLVLPGGGNRIADRYLKSVVGQDRSKEVIDALEKSHNIVPRSQPTAADAVANIGGGSPVLAAQKITAATPGGISAQFADRVMEQEAARRAVLQDLATRGTAEQQVVGRALQKKLTTMISDQPGKVNVIGKENPTEFLKALIKDDLFVKSATGIPKPLDQVYNKNQMKKLLAVAEELKTKLQVQHPAQKTALQGGVNIAEETRTHFPQMLSRPMMIANAVLKTLAGQKGVEPAVDKALARKFLNPQELAEALKDVPPGTKEQIIKAILNSGNVTAGAAAFAGQQEGH